MQEALHESEGNPYDPDRWIQAETVAKAIIDVMDLRAGRLALGHHHSPPLVLSAVTTQGPHLLVGPNCQGIALPRYGANIDEYSALRWL